MNLIKDGKFWDVSGIDIETEVSLKLISEYKGNNVGHSLLALWLGKKEKLC